MAISGKEFLQKIDTTVEPEAREPMLKQYVFKTGKDCKEGSCIHSRGLVGVRCGHASREGERYMEPLSFNKCDCAAVKEVDSTIAPFIFKTCPACFEGACYDTKVGGKCEHTRLHGIGCMTAQSYNLCMCGTVARGPATGEIKLFENKTGYVKPSDIVRGHNYSNKYMPSHCCACGLIRGSKEICVPMPMFEVVQRVEHYIEVHTMVASRRYELEKPAAIVPQIYRGNLSPLYPVTWGLIGGPLAQRRRT